MYIKNVFTYHYLRDYKVKYVCTYCVCELWLDRIHFHCSICHLLDPCNDVEMINQLSQTQSTADLSQAELQYLVRRLPHLVYLAHNIYIK